MVPGTDLACGPTGLANCARPHRLDPGRSALALAGKPRELLADDGDLRYVWRHLPLTDVHPHALLAAEGAEAAARQGRFWPMHDQLLDHQDALTADDLIRYAAQLGLDTGRFTADLRRHAGEAKITEDVDSADLSGVTGTPTFFVNGKYHRGAYDIDTLAGAVRAAKAHALISSGR